VIDATEESDRDESEGERETEDDAGGDVGQADDETVDAIEPPCSRLIGGDIWPSTVKIMSDYLDNVCAASRFC
jgi:hypothetical protein